MKKWLSLVEVIISIFVISIIGIFVMWAISNFFLGIHQMKTIKSFSSNYNNMLNYMYSNSYAWWSLYDSNGTGLVMYNTWYVDGLTGFVWYDCLENSITSSNLSFNPDEIIWDEFDEVFTGITCNIMTGWNVNGGYWLNFNVSVLENPVDLKYFFKTQ